MSKRLSSGQLATVLSIEIATGCIVPVRQPQARSPEDVTRGQVDGRAGQSVLVGECLRTRQGGYSRVDSKSNGIARATSVNASTTSKCE